MRAVPADHTALFASLGMLKAEPVLQRYGMMNRFGSMLSKLITSRPNADFEAELADVTFGLTVKPMFQQAAHYLCRWAEVHSDAASSSTASTSAAGGSSQHNTSTNPSASQPPSSASTTPPWLVPAMQTCFEVATLWPGSNAGILHTCLELSCALADCSEATSTSSQACSSSSKAASFAALLAHPVLHQLGLAVLHQDKADDPYFNANRTAEGLVRAMVDCMDAGAGAVPSEQIDSYLERQAKRNEAKLGRQRQLRSSLQGMYGTLMEAVVRAGA
jgi:hypothetical protein